MRALIGVAVLAAAFAAVAGALSPPRPVSLTITYWDDETKATELSRWTLRCNPLGGTLATRKRACSKLATLGVGSFAPVPRDTICTEIYGGPDKAVVKGTIGGQRVWASFRRRNGCEISRWDRFAPWLLPAAGGFSRAG